jgi:hypothetical protein
MAASIKRSPSTSRTQTPLVVRPIYLEVTASATDAAKAVPIAFLPPIAGLPLGTLGGGPEIALTNNITVKSEYSYVNLGDGGGTKVLAQSMIGGIGFHPASFTATSNHLNYHIVRFGLNFKSDP